jgi:hypothetical protein
MPSAGPAAVRPARPGLIRRRARATTLVAIAAWFRLDDARERGEKYGNPYSGGSRRTAAQLVSVAKDWRSSLPLWLQFGAC